MTNWWSLTSCVAVMAKIRIVGYQSKLVVMETTGAIKIIAHITRFLRLSSSLFDVALFWSRDYQPLRDKWYKVVTCWIFKLVLIFKLLEINKEPRIEKSILILTRSKSEIFKTFFTIWFCQAVQTTSLICFIWNLFSRQPSHKWGSKGLWITVNYHLHIGAWLCRLYFDMFRL